MLSWLWGGSAGGGAAPQVAPALRKAQEALGDLIVSRIRIRAPFPSDQSLARACGLGDEAATLARHLGGAVRACGDEQGAAGSPASTISGDAAVVAAARALTSPDWAWSVLAGGGDADVTVALPTVEAVLRDLLRVATAVTEASAFSDAAAAALAQGAAYAQAAGDGLGGGPPPSAPAAASSSPSLTREAFRAWTKQGSGVVVVELLSALLRPLGQEAQAQAGEQHQRALGGAARPPELMLDPSPSPPLLTPPLALALAPHVPDPKRRRRWRLVYSSARHGKSWSVLCGRLQAAGASAARAVEARADAAALAAAAAAGGGARGRVARKHAQKDEAQDEPGKDAGPPATLVLVRDGQGAVFGGAAFSPWQRRPAFYGDASAAFLFALHPTLRVHHSSGINANAQFFSGAQAFSSLPNGLGMGGQMAMAFGLFVDAQLERGHSRPNATFACAPLCSPPAQDFDVAEVEVWAMPTPDEEEDGEGGAAAAAAAAGRRGVGGGGGTVLDAAAETRNFLAVAGRFADHSAGVRD
jgi:hypothetical protein